VLVLIAVRTRIPIRFQGTATNAAPHAHHGRPRGRPSGIYSHGVFHTQARAHDRTHGTISMTGCRYGAEGFRPLGPPIPGGALLRSTTLTGLRPHPTPAARRWRARGRLRRTSPSPPPVNAALLCYRRSSASMDATRPFATGAAPSLTAWGSQRRRSGSSALAKGEVRRRRWCVKCSAGGEGCEKV
jgi:hypothetical protein